MSEKIFVTLLVGKLLLAIRDKIIELNDVEQLYFQDVISYFRKKHKEDSYRLLTRARSTEGDKAMGQVCVARD